MTLRLLPAVLLAASAASAQAPLVQTGVQLQAAIKEAKSFDPEVSRMLERLRAPGERKSRMSAISGLEKKYADAYFMDQRRIVDGLLDVSSDNDLDIARLSLYAAARIAAQAAQQYGATSYEVSQRVRANVTGRLERDRANPFQDPAAFRSDLFRAYETASRGSADLNGIHDDVFVGEALRDVRERMGLRGDRHKAVAMKALADFLAHNGRIIGTYRHEHYMKAADVLVEAARRDPFGLAPGSRGADQQADAEFRHHFARALAATLADRFHGSPRVDPALRIQVRDLLERMYHDETEPMLKQKLGVYLGRLPRLH